MCGFPSVAAVASAFVQSIDESDAHISNSGAHCTPSGALPYRIHAMFMEVFTAVSSPSLVEIDALDLRTM